MTTEARITELLARHYELLARLRELDDDAETSPQAEIPYSVRRWRGME